MFEEIMAETSQIWWKALMNKGKGNHQLPTRINSSRYIPKISYLKCWKAKRKSPKQQAKNDSLHLREPQ